MAEGSLGRVSRVGCVRNQTGKPIVMYRGLVVDGPRFKS